MDARTAAVTVHLPTNTGARASPPRSTSPTARPRPPASRPGLATRLTRREFWGAQFLTFECWVFVLGLSVWIVLLDRLFERLRGQSHADRPGRRAETSRRRRGSTAQARAKLDTARGK